MKAVIEQMERTGLYDSEVMGPRPKKSREEKEFVKSNKTSKPNSGNCIVVMAPKSKAQQTKEKGQCKQEEAKGIQDTQLAAKRDK